MLALVIGTLLAVGALAFVLYPLFEPALAKPRIRRREPAEPAESEPIVALREIEFDRATGKLSDGDYAELKARYTERALARMRMSASPGTADDPIEALIRGYRETRHDCVRCGPRPEPDAIYCSNCGNYLPGACAGCGTHVNEEAAAYCSACGRLLAA